MYSKKQNHLAFEKSPYLLQHADNPVDWYPWAPEAFARAKRENKPVFLSIGYSTCHWCHVMAHESFEDPVVAGLMNAAFVSIKVDREERPDIDLFYMNVCQKVTGSGGWPLTIIMTPEKEAFFAGTYIPRETRFGRLGMIELIPRIQEVWSQQPGEARAAAGKIKEILRVESPEPGPASEPDEAALQLAFEQLEGNFDPEYGGFGNEPKFPPSHSLQFLLRYWKRTSDPKALEMVEKTLQAMRLGGVYDQLGFGFHRYSTDRFWLVPHFEKMLYDQALLSSTYLDAYQATRKKEYAETAREILTYVLRDMTAPQGGFYSAEDADSEGQEGRFYIWSLDQIKQALDPAELDLALKVFNIAADGNFAQEEAPDNNAGNILHLKRLYPEIAADAGISVTALRERLKPIAAKLFEYRNKRTHPYKDDKILVDWNGLMIASLAKAARILDQPDYAAAARRALDFILGNMTGEAGQIWHRYRDGEAAIPANLDDYAFLIQGMLELFQTSFDPEILKKALALNTYLLEHFWDVRKGGFFFTADTSEQLPVRSKEIYDGALPSGNSVAMLNLLRLGRLTANPELEKRASQIGRAFPGIQSSPAAYTQLLAAVDFGVGPSIEVVIVGDLQAADTRAMIAAVNREFRPNQVLVQVPVGSDSRAIHLLAPYTAQQTSVNGKATAYVCQNYQCRLPVTEVNSLKKLLNS